MEKIDVKLDTFAAMVMKDAAHKAGILLNEAKQENHQLMEDKEIAFLKDAYHSIQQAINKLEKENNELFSAKLFEAKQLLFKKRQEIMNSVFERVQNRLEQYRAGDEYTGRLESFLRKGISEVGQGDLVIFVDSTDTARIESIKGRFTQTFAVENSDEPLLGGCIVMNRTTGLMADYSFSLRLMQQRESFLENSGMNINL